MENASKALIMGAEILIGVMILSIGVYLFNSLGSYSAETTQEIESTRLEQFNEQFSKFYGTVSTQPEGGTTAVEQTIRCTMQDVVGTANLAKMHNLRNGFEDAQEVNENPNLDGLYYIQIDLKTPSRTMRHIEQMEQDELVNLLKDNGNYGITVETDERGDTVANTKYYKVTELNYSDITGRVNYMMFVYDENL